MIFFTNILKNNADIDNKLKIPYGSGEGSDLW